MSGSKGVQGKKRYSAPRLECVPDKENPQLFCLNRVWKVHLVSKASESGNEKETKMDDEREPLFTFFVTRQKSSETGKERLVICATDVSGDADLVAGEITATMPNLVDDLLTLREYGVVIPRSGFGVVARAIEAAYLNLTVKPEEFETDITAAKIEQIFELFAMYIKEVGFERTGVNRKQFACYNITNDEFWDVLSNSEYRHLDPVEVKKALLDKKYIRANAGRYDVNIKGKTGRFIAFLADAVDAKAAEMEKR